jgi:hypothetical protein
MICWFKATRIVVLFLLLFVVGVTDALVASPPQYYAGTGHWYQVVTRDASMDWFACRDSALSWGGYLAEIASQAENDFVRDLGAPVAYTYLGGTDDGHESTWVWINTGTFWDHGVSSQYANWGPGEPNDGPQGSENFLTMSTETSPNIGKWNDRVANWSDVPTFVVEYNLPPSWCDGFEDGSAWNSRWVTAVGSPTVVASPTHSGSGGLRFNGCHSEVYRKYFQALTGEYSGWFRIDNPASAEVYLYVGVQPGPDSLFQTRTCYYARFFKSGSWYFEVIRKQQGGSATTLGQKVADSLNFNEWDYGFLRIEHDGKITVGYMKQSGFRDSVTVVDPAPLSSVGMLGLSACSGYPASNVNYWDDVCYNEVVPIVDSCKFANALRFDRDDDWVRIANTSNVNFPNGVSVEAWVKIPEFPPTPDHFAIVTKSLGTVGQGGTGGFQFGINSTPYSGRLHFYTKDGYVLSNSALSPNQWYHVAATYNGSDVKFYINGSLDNTASLGGGLPPVASDIAIGYNSAHFYNPGLGPNAFEGTIDEVRISDTVRAPGDFCLTAPCTADAHTVGLWHLDETCGSLALDASGHMRHGTIVGAQHVGCASYTDTDGDCIADSLDDCPAVYNPLQEDHDLNGIGDSCDLRVWFDSTTIHDGYIQVMMKNPFDVAAFTLPLRYRASVLFDSASQVGCRTADWKQFGSNVIDDSTVVVVGTARWGSTGSCMIPGTGPIARLYFANACNGTQVVCLDTTYINETNGLKVTECPSISHVPDFLRGCATYGWINTPPVADAGPDVSIDWRPVGSSKCVPAVCSDPDGNLVACDKIDGPGAYDGSQICFQPAGYGDYVFVLRATDACGALDYDTVVVSAINCGDPNGDYATDISDVVFLISYIFTGGAAPEPKSSGDVNADCAVDIGDPVYLIQRIFGGGPAAQCGCARGDALAKAPSGSAEIECSTSSRSTNISSLVQMTAERASAGVQLAFTIPGNTEITGVKSYIEGMDVFSGLVDGEYRVGLIDMTGKTVIPAGQHEVVTISYQGEGTIELKSAIVVGEDASKMNVTITNKGVIENGGQSNALPKAFSLAQNVPNPFNPTTSIAYAVPQPTFVKLEVMNVLGQTVRTLVNEYKAAGNYSVVWDGRDNNNQSVASGIYLYRLTAGDYGETRKMVLMK